MPQARTKPSAYLDHSVMNLLEKGKLSQDRVNRLAEKFLVCYSPENVKEIVASPDYIESFCRVLESLDAHYISLNLDQVGTDSECVASGFEPSRVLEGAVNQTESLGESSLREFLAHTYGVSDQSFGETFASLGRFFDQTVSEGIQGIEELELTPEVDEVRKQLEMLQGSSFSDEFSGFGQHMDGDLNCEEKGSPIEQYAGLSGLRADILANLRGQENVVETIKQMEAGALGLPIEQTSLTVALNLEHIKTRADRVTVIYNWLNWVGFRRDSGVKTNRRKFEGYLEDMGHVSYASYCDMFLTADSRQADKARVSFEALGLDTVVAFIKPNGSETPVVADV